MGPAVGWARSISSCCPCSSCACACPPTTTTTTTTTTQAPSRRTFLCCSCSLHGSLGGLSFQSPPPPPAAPACPSLVTCTRAAACGRQSRVLPVSRAGEGRGCGTTPHASPLNQPFPTCFCAAHRVLSQECCHPHPSRPLTSTHHHRRPHTITHAIIHIIIHFPHPPHLDLLWAAAHDDNLGAALEPRSLQRLLVLEHPLEQQLLRGAR